MRGWLPKTRGQLLTGFCALALLTTHSFGAFRAQRALSETVDGVDEFGNASALLGDEGPGKSYKNIQRGIIVQITRSTVLNRFLRPRQFRNRGLSILDPQTNESLTTTRDLLIVVNKPIVTLASQSPVSVTQQINSLWFATQLKVYDPRYPVLTPQTTTTTTTTP